MQKQAKLWLKTEMNQEPSQFCSPPSWRGATFNVPLPNRPTLSDMWVNGPIVYECLDSMLRSQVHLLQRDAPASLPTGASSSPPWWAGPAVRLRVPHVRERMGTDELYVCLAACVTGSVRDLVRTHAGTGKKDTNTTSEEKQKVRSETVRLTKVSGKEIQPLKEAESSNLWTEELWIWGRKKKTKNVTWILYFVLNC